MKEKRKRVTQVEEAVVKNERMWCGGGLVGSIVLRLLLWEYSKRDVLREEREMIDHDS